VKTHLEKWIKALRRRFPGVGYLWVLEFQKRRVPHYHVWLTVQPDTTLQKKMARSWVRITKGTESQYWWHCRKENWIEWKMEDGQYAKKYAVKQVQKEVPPEYQNVGRFWASSRNLKPEPTHYGPEEVAKLTRTTAVPWEAAAVRHYFDKVLRRFQEHQMNYDRQGRRRINPKTGKVQPYRKAAMVRSCSELSGNFKIRNGSKAIAQLLNYIVTHPPDPYSLAKAIAARVPF
jgi:hypothetical protein